MPDKISQHCRILKTGRRQAPALVRLNEWRLQAAPAAGLQATRTHARGVIIPITGEISDVTTESIQRRVEQARAAQADLIIFELDTPGGMASSALDICDYIKNLSDLTTVTWINTQAYSAGAMIAMACDEIVMSSRSTLGDCGVILGGPTGPEAVPEELKAKAESPVLEQFRDSAARNSYDVLLCEAMVIHDREIFWIENATTGERRFVTADEKNRLLAESPAPASAPASQPAAASAPSGWRMVESYTDPVTGKSIRVIQPVVRPTELLTVSQSTAYVFGFCQAILSSREELRSHYGLVGEWQNLDFTWSELLTGWLTSMPVRIFLLIIVFLGAYVEFNAPGIGLPGLVALICLALFVGGPYLTGLANIWEIVLILIGLGLLAVEIFVLPGFGVAGVLGIVCVLAGLLATFIPEEPGRPFPLYWPNFEWGIRGLKYGVMAMAAAMVTSVAGMVVISRYLPRVPWMRSFAPENPTVETVAVEDPYRGYARVGDVGVVESPLRPAGKARFGPILVDVVSEGELIDPPAEVEVIERSGNRVVVRRAR